jgi:hypothetical protein
MEDLSEELISINQLLDTYFQGIYEGSMGMLHAIYHPYTVLFGDVKGQPYTRTKSLTYHKILFNCLHIIHFSDPQPVAHRIQPWNAGRNIHICDLLFAELFQMHH